MFQLPPATFINKSLPKKAIYKKFCIKTADRNHFDSDINRLSILAHISADTVPALPEGKNIKGIYVLMVLLKHKEYDAQNLLLLNRLIPQKMVFALQYENEIQWAIYYVNILTTDWQPIDSATLRLSGLDLDMAWKHIIAGIAHLDLSSKLSLEEQIMDRERREKIQHQIESLERQCRIERQPRRKYELHQQILILKKEIET
ncbi:MAG: DUF4391 domain-containing protein [Prevotella sp.]|jgi:hypothetical protein|nr:DUF4391 domain-containing protein [Prevotella sp.]MCI1781857.1 DUF4391 domain-containing protein [Prevotella sp.]MCI1802864.1 DUF4391 domain-containing protein [Prevotella sp.]MCI1848542.1 DUF4391 domain-containing protein [Prevotella sp.]